MILSRGRVGSAFTVFLGAILMFGVAQMAPASADTILGTPVQVNFQAQTTPTPAGYLPDFGQAYDATRGYGWTTIAGTPLNLTANGRQRNVNPNPLLDTFVHMQAPSGSGTTTPGAWKAAVANGTYTVTVGVGDPSNFDSRDVLNVEGTKIVDFTPTTANRQLVTSASVVVSDGFLNVNATGGTNTKIDYLTAVLQPPPDTTPPTVAVDVSGTTDAGGNYVGSATVTITATDAGSGVQSTSYTLDTGTAQVYSAPFAVTAVGPHTVTATSVDVANNTSAPVTTTFTIVAGPPPVDTTPPAVAVDVSGTTDASGNYVASATVTITATDAESGVQSTSYTVDGGAAQVYSAPFAVTAVGPHTVTATSVDVANNTSAPVTKTFTVVAADTTPPAVAVDVSGTTDGGGNYVASATVTITATDAGSGVQSTSYSLDGGAAQVYSAPFAVTAVGPHTVTATSVDVANNTSAPVTKTFTIVAPAPSLQVTSPEDNLGLGSRLVFSTVSNQYRTGHSLTLTNLTSVPVSVTGLTFGGANALDFKVCPGQVTSFVIAGNGSAAVCVRYTPQVNAALTATFTSQGTLTIATSDAAKPTYVVTLGGLSAKAYESYNEPSLQQMFNALGYTTNVGVSNKPQGNSISADSAAVADEVLAPYFLALNPAQPVKLIPLAHYSGKNAATSASFGWNTKYSLTSNYLYAFPGGADGTNNGYGQNQLLLPTTTTGSSGVNTMSFTPPGSFGLLDNYPGYASRSDDLYNGSHWHNLRIYPAKDASGAVIPGSYLVGNDVGAPADNSAKNWDYQDFAFLLVNATPDPTATQPTPGVYNKTLASFPGGAGGISGTGFTTAQGTITPSKIALVNNRLQITTSNDTNTSHTNALQLGVSSGAKFRIQSRLIGPFDAINAGSEQQGIYYGPSGTNYIKAEIDWNPTDSTRRLTVWKELNGAGSILYSILLPTGNANTVDLRIDVDPSPQDTAHYNKDPLVSIFYALNGSTTFTKINTADLNIPPSWITANTPAGIMTSHQGGGTAFTAIYASFGVTRNF